MTSWSEAAEECGEEQGASGPAVAAFCALETTGPDPAADRLLRICALRPVAGGAGWDELELECDRGESPADGGESRALEPRDAWRELAAFLGPAPVVVAAAQDFAAWSAHFTDPADPASALGPFLGLDELTALFFPGRPAVRREPPSPSPSAPTPATGHTPAGLRDAMAQLRRRLRAGSPAERELRLAGCDAARHGLLASEPESARRIELALQLVSGTRERAPAPDPERFSALLDELRPRWTRSAKASASSAPLPPHADAADAALSFPDEDHSRLDAVFTEHLPALFGPGSYRESQHQVAREIARTLGAEGGELLLVHAPTGTGKTLAYLVPAMLWALRHGLRVGVATYTRALQEQAMDREVPRARAALERSGAGTDFAVATLKGRDNYLCWRSLRLALPEADADGEELLAWSQLALFALTDETGDLDRLPLRAPLRLEAGARYERVLAEIARQARAHSACCAHEKDRASCAADVARWRAERSHVVITNHSFALARQDFFRHVVFDECEHLHDQAHAAFSHSVALRSVGDQLRRLRSGGERHSRDVLSRVEHRLTPGTRSHGALLECFERHQEAAGAAATLERTVEDFLAWRSGAARERGERDEHALLREYASCESGAPLVEARRALCASLAGLEASLSGLAEALASLPARAFASKLRSIELARGDLLQTVAGLDAWIPLHDGGPRFGPETFHDVQVDARGDATLVARVLLPGEFLGCRYHPQLATGVFLSAATWLRDGFDSALSYLGLDRAAEPGPDEDRPPMRVRAFRAPEVFDYGRVLLAVPRDAPPVTQSKDEFLAYVGAFLATLGERTRGRVLGLFTNAEDLKRVGARLEGFFRARSIPFWYQNMKGTAKEELGDLFRRRAGSILLGVDTFWYGADFPGEILEYLVIVKLPYGVPDGYHHAQCAALGASEQRRRIYMPRALSKFRQGFGRLMRAVDDRGCVFVLDRRLLEPRHRSFLRELPLRDELMPGAPGARLVRGDTEHCLREALSFMGIPEPSTASPPALGMTPAGHEDPERP